MKAFTDTTFTKAEALAEMRMHRDADTLVRGEYWDDMKREGCAVGCLTENPDGGHEKYPQILGIPEQLAYLEDFIFESLPTQDSQTWPERFLSAIPEGSDQSLTWPRFAIWMLTDPKWGVAQQTKGTPSEAAAVEAVADLYRRAVCGQRPTEEDFDTVGQSAHRRESIPRHSLSAAYKAARTAWQAARAAHTPFAAAEAAGMASLIRNTRITNDEEAWALGAADALVRFLEMAD